MPDGGCRCGSHRAGRDTSGDVTSAQDPGADSAGEDAVTDQDHRADPWGWALVEGLGRRDHHGGRDGRDDDLRGQDPILLYYVGVEQVEDAARRGGADQVEHGGGDGRAELVTDQRAEPDSED